MVVQLKDALNLCIKFLTGDALKDHTWTDEKDKPLNLSALLSV
jgi:hypothetical protein